MITIAVSSTGPAAGSVPSGDASSGLGSGLWVALRDFVPSLIVAARNLVVHKISGPLKRVHHFDDSADCRLECVSILSLRAERVFGRSK